MCRLRGAFKEIGMPTEFTDPQLYRAKHSDIEDRVISQYDVIEMIYKLHPIAAVANGDLTVGNPHHFPVLAISDHSMLKLSDAGIWIVVLDYLHSPSPSLAKRQSQKAAPATM